MKKEKGRRKGRGEEDKREREVEGCQYERGGEGKKREETGRERMRGNKAENLRKWNRGEAKSEREVSWKGRRKRTQGKWLIPLLCAPVLYFIPLSCIAPDSLIYCFFLSFYQV